MTKTIIFGIALVWIVLPSEAQAWEWLKSSNKHVEEGNEKMEANDHKGALEAYDKAARELPSKGGVHLNRGLALLKGGDLSKAKQALLLATEPEASSEIRARAYYNLGISFYREADQKAAEENHEEAQKLFREAADTLKRSLRLKPQNRDAAWNLELALRRIRQEEQKQKEKEQKEKEQQEKEQKENQEKQPGEDQQDNQNQQDQKPEDQQQKQDQPDTPKDDPKKEQKKKPSSKEEPQEEPPPSQQEQKQEPRPLPQDVERSLDALQKGEENLERHKARIRAARERRQPEKDW